MKINPRFLRSHQLLSLLPSATLRKLATGSGMRDYPKGSVVFTQGEECGAMYLIISGRCESRHVDRSGHLITNIRGPGETLGDREVIHHEGYNSTVTVVTQSVLLKIPAEELAEVMESEPKVAGRLSQSIFRQVMADHSVQVQKRIVALHALSGRIHERALARRLAEVVGEVTGRRVLTVHLGPANATNAAVALGNWGEIEPSLNGVFYFAQQVREVRSGSYELDVRVGENAAEAAYVAPLLSHLGSHFDYVLINAGEDVPTAALLECLVQSDLTYILMRPDGGCLYRMKLLMNGLASNSGKTYKHISPVICADSFEAAAKFSDDCEKMGCAVHSILRGYPLADTTGGMDRSPFFTMQIRRMAREIG